MSIVFQNAFNHGFCLSIRVCWIYWISFFRKWIITIDCCTWAENYIFTPKFIHYLQKCNCSTNIVFIIDQRLRYRNTNSLQTCKVDNWMHWCVFYKNFFKFLSFSQINFLKIKIFTWFCICYFANSIKNFCTTVR